MKVYDTGSIRNVVLLGHGSAGKTTVAECLCYVTKVTNRLGSVDEGNTVSDFDKEEKKRKFSISTSLLPIEVSPWLLSSYRFVKMRNLSALSMSLRWQVAVLPI